MSNPDEPYGTPQPGGWSSIPQGQGGVPAQSAHPQIPHEYAEMPLEPYGGAEQASYGPGSQYPYGGAAQDAAGQGAAGQGWSGYGPGGQPQAAGQQGYGPQSPYGAGAGQQQAYQQPGYQPAYGQPQYAAPAAPKSMAVAIILAVFLGGIGVHNYYLGYTTKGLVQLGVNVVSWLLMAVYIGAFGIMGLGIWIIVDIIQIASRSGQYVTDSRGIPLQ